MLGDMVETALKSIGLTTEIAEKWLGAECGCKERQEKLNQLTWWARTAIRQGDQSLSNTTRWLYDIIGIG